MIRSYQDHKPVIGSSSYIDPSAQVIGQVTLGQHCSVWPLVTIRGDVNTITIGHYTNIQDHSVLHVTHDSTYHAGQPLHIDDYVTVGHQCTLHACTIGHHCLIGMGSQVLDRALIQPGVFLGAGSIVTEGKTLESGYLYLGRPAQKIRTLTEQEKKFLHHSAIHYAQLKDDYLSPLTV